MWPRPTRGSSVAITTRLPPPAAHGVAGPSHDGLPVGPDPAGVGPRLGHQVGPESDARDPEADRVRGEVRHGQAQPGDGQGQAQRQARLRAGRAVITWAVAAGRTSRANTSSDPVIWLVSAAATPSSTRNTTDRACTGTPRLCAVSGSTVANSRGRPMAASTARATVATAASTTTWVTVMPRKLPNRRLSTLEVAGVEGHEQEAAGQGEGLGGADDGGLLARRPGPRAGYGRDDQRGRDAAGQVAIGRR